MTESSASEHTRPVEGVVQQLARDDVERKKFGAQEDLTPDGAFDKPLSKKQVLAKAGPLIKE